MMNERSRQVLCSVVESYIHCYEPVGSRFVVKRYGLNFSPATIRSIMSDLEEMGLLAQPHTSAGRVPTDKGFRYYVDLLSAEPSNRDYIDAFESYIDTLKRKFEDIHNDLNNMLMRTTAELSLMSSYLAFAVPSWADGATLNRIQMYSYRGRQVAVMLLTNEGMIKNKILETDFGISQKDLNRISDFLNSEFSGQTIGTILQKLINQVSKEKALCDVIVTRVIDVCREALTFPPSDLICSGLPGLLKFPDVSARINDVVRAIEDKEAIIRLLDGFAFEDGVHVLIGSENPVREMDNLSIVVSTYKQGDRTIGSVGMIGPTRMDYSRAIPIVKKTAEFLTKTISD